MKGLGSGEAVSLFEAAVISVIFFPLRQRPWPIAGVGICKEAISCPPKDFQTSLQLILPKPIKRGVGRLD